MVNLSPKLLMKESLALQIFQSFHQPPTLNTRESQKLLKLLTTSFRQQLDQEHGGFRKEFRKDNLLPSPPNSINPSSRRRSLSEPNLPTDRHFRSILTNPLFLARNSSSKKPPPTSPMDMFELAVSKGLMTMAACHNCLIAEKKRIVSSSAATVWEGMRDSGAGLKVLKWLKASGLKEDGQYLMDDFFGTLAQFVVAEGLQEAIWYDFAIVAGKGPTNGPNSPPRTLIQIIDAELKGPKDVDGAISALKMAFQIVQHLPEAQRKAVIQPSTRKLIYNCTVLSQEHAKPSPTNFEALVDITSRVFRTENMYMAHLDLHHPTKPSPKNALKLFRNFSNKSFTTKQPTAIISLGLDAAKYLLEQERVNEAREIMDILQSSYPNQLGIPEIRKIRQAKSEAWSLELLEGLRLA